MKARRPAPPQLQRRALVAGAVLTPLLAACGGGGEGSSGTDNTGTLPDGTPSYGGGRTPGSALVLVTDKVTMTVSMPDISGVADFSKLSLDEFNALPMVSRTINIGLDRVNAPLSTANFLSYVKSGAYVGTIFHRVLAGFVSQGGGFTVKDGTNTAITTTGTVPLESRNGLANMKGTIAMARTDDPNSGTSQFYFNLVNNIFLNYASPASPGYAVFGSVMDEASVAVLNDMNTIATRAADGNGVLLRNYTITAVAQV